MSAKNMLFSFLTLSSMLVHCAHQKINIEKPEELVQSLYEKKTALFTLDTETIALCIQTLKENKAVLKHMIAHQTGFFNNRPHA